MLVIFIKYDVIELVQKVQSGMCGFWCGQLVVWMIGDDKDLAPYTTVLCDRSFMYFAQITARNNIRKW